MRRFISLAAMVSGLYLGARWWREHPRVGTDLMNRSVNPWLERHGFVSGSNGELAVIEHIGRTSGTVRRTLIHPMPTDDGFRIIVPVGTSSQWARNVVAAGHCSMIIGDRRYELDEPVFETPAEVPGLPGPVRALFDWLGFRYLRLHTFAETPAEPNVAAAPPDAPPVAPPAPDEEPGAVIAAARRPGRRARAEASGDRVLAASTGTIAPD